MASTLRLLVSNPTPQSEIKHRRTVALGKLKDGHKQVEAKDLMKAWDTKEKMFTFL